MQVKKYLVVALIAELLIAYFVLAPICILRQEQVRAFAAWHNNPTNETRAERDRQAIISEAYRLGFSFVVFSMMVGPTLLVFRSWKRRQSV